MAIERWQPRTTYTKQEDVLLRRLRRTRKLFAFLRDHRRELFDDEFQSELATMYRDTGAGKDPVPPALLAMASLLQGYLKVSDAETVEMTVVDLRWQMVLDRLGLQEPAFSQGALHEFRERLIRTDMDRRLLERTAEFARRTNAFDWRKLPKDLRVAVDSSPLEGAGRVEDTINLLGHAARKVVDCAADLLGWNPERVAREAGIPVLLESSVKKGLDRVWGTEAAMNDAVSTLVHQLDALEEWLKNRLANEIGRPPLKEHIETLQQLREQDLEPDPSGKGRTRIREGTAEDRRISIEDKDMRHGRKSKSQRINGYKRHIATDLDTQLIVACAVTPANRPEQEAMQPLQDDIAALDRSLRELHIDRGYVASPIVSEILDGGGLVLCKPWVPQNGDLYSKADFKLNLRTMTITCPAGEMQPIELGATVSFPHDTCRKCVLRDQCTASTSRGRQVRIAEDEFLQQRLRKLVASPSGRERMRERVGVEHSLAHLSRRQGSRARYRGTRRNLYDVRRAAVLQNLETVQRQLERKAA
jgi:predicted kinase